MKTYRPILFSLSMLLFTFIFLSDNRIFRSFAQKVEHDLLQPYRQQFDEQTADIPDRALTPESEPTAPAATLAPTIKIIYVTPTPLTTVLEDDLWQALKVYRNAQQRTEIAKSDALCIYARSRVDELQKRLIDHPDSPLDAHAGFERDADSGYVFDSTGFSMVGENLAYTPNYSNAAQIIEWGWDTSSGHRALQLSDDITHGCIAGSYPIYVGIFGK